jgi:hypothetical protein
MARIDVRCTDDNCGVLREVDRRVSEYPSTPPCPVCGAPTVQMQIPVSQTASRPDAVVVYQAPDGSFRFPGETSGTGCAKYDQMGYQRIEARGWAEVRALERRVNQHEESEIRRKVERTAPAIEAADAARRAEIRRGLQQGFRIPVPILLPNGQVVHSGRMFDVHMRPRSTDVIRRAQDLDARKGHRQPPREVGFHVDAYSNDRSNRDESRDSRGMRRRD